MAVAVTGGMVGEPSGLVEEQPGQPVRPAARG